MGYIIQFVVLVGLLMISTSGHGQPLQVEVSVAGQGIEGSPSVYGKDLRIYPGLTVAYQVAEYHRIGLTLSVLSGSLYESRNPGEESGTNIQMTTYPIGLQYQYRRLPNALLQPYLKASLLVMPTKDEWETDTPASQASSVNGGANLGLGVDWKLTRKWGMFSTINYRLVFEDKKRPLQHIDLAGFNAQLGLKVYL
ncbi:outer membrane beta-barrel protein [Fodinibius roseus]|nr:outer membrane beta-barrel protein [Fodinibius roseus]